MKILPAIAASALITATAHADVFIYEPFADSDPSLAGNTPGLGLSGSWSSDGVGVSSGSLSWGSLETSGNQTLTSGSNFRDGSVDASSGLAGKLDDGDVIWMSFLAQSISNGRSYVTIGTGGPDGFDRIGGGGGFGVGVRLENGNVHAHGWSGSAVKPAGAAVADGTVFVVAKITWASSGNNDTVEVFLPGTDLVQPGTAASTLSFDFAQSVFTVLGLAGSTPPIPNIDEIRFGDSYADVTPVPEPGSLALLGLGGLLIARRRRG